MKKESQKFLTLFYATFQCFQKIKKKNYPKKEKKQASKVAHNRPRPQIREQMSVPDLYVVTVAFLALKKLVFLR